MISRYFSQFNCFKSQILNLTNFIQIWTRPILPKNSDSHSYAVAYVSLRTDGAPYRIQFNLTEIGLKNSAGYVELVRAYGLRVSNMVYIQCLSNCRISLKTKCQRPSNTQTLCYL